METFRCTDPGPGRRLDGDARAALAGAVRGWQRAHPPVVLVEVEGDAWSAEGPVDLDDHGAITRAQALVLAMRAVPCPVVVAVGRAVSGLGTALLLAADVRFGSDGITIASGDSPTAALLATTALPDGRSTILERLAWTGDRLDIAAALAAGLLTGRGSPSDARACAERLAADPAGWAAVKRANRARARASAADAAGYQAWLLDAVLRG